MHISISGHHIAVTSALSESIHEKFSKIEKQLDKVNSTHVMLSLDNHHTDCSHKGQLNHKAEVILRVPGAELFAHATADDMYTSIALLSEKLDRQIAKYKSKRKMVH